MRCPEQVNTFHDLSQLKRLSVQSGSVFRMKLFPSDGITPKNPGDTSRNKYFVVIGQTEDSLLVAALVINTDINRNLAYDISPFQHEIRASEYGFLNGRDRYIDCYRIQEYDLERICREAEFKGIVSDADVQAAVTLTGRSPVNKPAVLKRYGFNTCK